MNINELYECVRCKELVPIEHFSKTNHLPVISGWIIPKKHHCGFETQSPLKWKIHKINCFEPTKIQRLFGFIK